MFSIFNHMDPTILVAILLASITTSAYAIWITILKRRLINKKPFDSLPMPPGNDAWTGHLTVFAKNPNPAMPLLLASETSKSHGRTGFWLGNQKGLAVTQWEDARAILQAESNRNVPFLQRKHIGQMTGKNSILLLNGREWKIHRAAINKAFTPVALKAYRDAMSQVTKTVVASIQKRIAHDGSFRCEMETLMKMITLDVFGLAAFSYDFGCCQRLETSPLAASFDDLSKDGDFRMKHPTNPSHYFYSLPTQRNIQRQQTETMVRSFVKQCMKERASMKNKPNDLLTLLMETVDSETEMRKDDVLDDIILTVLFAGYDTTSITLSYTLHVLSQNPHVEQQCVNEINAVGSIDKVEELVYCKAVIQEALRYYPPATTTARTIIKPVTLPDGFVIPEGTSAIVPIWAIHHNEANFPRPDEFLPERWAQPIANPTQDDSSDLSIRWIDRDSNDSLVSPVPVGNPKAFFAFSSGGRSCPGQKFAMHEAVVALAGLVQAFHFSTLPGYELQPTRKILIQHPHDQLPMILTNREN